MNSTDSHRNDKFVSNKDNWMKLPYPDSAVLSHRLLNSVRLFDVSGSAEGMRGMLIQAAREVTQLEARLSETRRSIPIADIERQIEDITKNGISLAKFGGEEAVEGRCRELCAMYLREFILTHRMSERLAELDKPEASAPCVAVPPQWDGVERRRIRSPEPNDENAGPVAAWAGGVCKTCGNSTHSCRCKHPGMGRVINELFGERPGDK